MNARELLGSTVRDRNGRAIGQVEEIVVDRLTGRVSFAVVAPHNDGNELLPVPWGALTWEPVSNLLKLQVAAHRVADAPTIDAADLEDLERREVGVEVFSFYGLQPPWEGRRST